MQNKKDLPSHEIFPVLVLVGPTSSGKTSLAIDLAKKHNAEIISADSRQVYKFMDVGTGKLPLDGKSISQNNTTQKLAGSWLVDGISIWGYDVVTPDANFTAYDYLNFATEKIAEIRKRNKNIILAGGTGLYIDVVTGAKILNHGSPKAKDRARYNEMPLEALVEKLEKLYPSLAAQVDLKNKRRVIRALESGESLGKVMGKDYRKNVNKRDSSARLRIREKFVIAGLGAPNSFLYNRADHWMDTIWSQTLIDEARFLLNTYPHSEKLNGLIYKTVIAYIKGNIPEKDALQRCKWDIHAYIRRQLTWFKKNRDIVWFDISTIGSKDCIINLSNLWIKKL